MKPRILAVLMLACLAAATLCAGPTPSQALLVLSKADHTMAIVDPVTLKVVAKLPSGDDPHEVEASSDGRLAYISNYGFGKYNTITVDDLVTQKPYRVIDLGVLHGPHGLDYAGGELYFTAEVNKLFGRYNPATEKIDWIMGTGQDRTHMIVVSNDLAHVFTSNVLSGTIGIFEKIVYPAGTTAPVGTNWHETVLETGPGTEGFDASPDGREVWAVARQSGTISVIDVRAKKVVQSLRAAVPGGGRLKFTPDGKYVLVSYSLTGGKGGVAVFNAATRREVKRLDLGCSMAGIVMQPDGRRAYVSCGSANYVVAIDTKGLDVVGRAYAGRGPDGLAWAERK